MYKQSKTLKNLLICFDAKMSINHYITFVLQNISFIQYHVFEFKCAWWDSINKGKFIIEKFTMLKYKCERDIIALYE